MDWLAIIFVAFVMLNCLLYNPGDAVAGLSLTSAMMLTRYELMLLISNL